ncbi:acetyl-CoA C-acyltransferase [Rhodomicrobium sp. Az07]|uniref:acetyl-CoA C-acyltransferase n=1 Tax=Rhodomicrobium sp. Az07 TaxID=2839034 RepID=UPI001BE9ED5D|nr:acetyl-CoA C-acyltransferase [Rhodomicrobium sp. Az07]MBT3072011.1 acetyl-CoA C-acyltransferase [Rhodomicrobium sp. Az07]
MNESTDAIVIASAVRTPIGAFQGAFASLAAPELGAAALRAAVERAGLPASEIDEVVMGCVLGAGVGQAPARQASLRAGLSVSAGCTTINKVCGSGLKAVMLGHDLIAAGSARVVAAGGMESMTNAPYLLPKARGGQRLGHDRILDAMVFDGLEDAYAPETKGRLMGTFAEDCAGAYGFTREAQDAYAVASATRARAAVEGGAFDWETAPVTVEGRKGALKVERDETPGRIDIAKIPTLKPAFREGGSVTAANSSSISDGAAAVTLMRRSTAEAKGVAPLATILGHATYAGEPRLFPNAPVHAIRALLSKLGWEAGDVDLYEINEAFAVVAMAAMRDLGLPHDKVNIHGGACALGHPIGASGARVLVTLIGALRRARAKRGVASLCIGGGEAVAMAVELA